jgi:rRNA processing protein Krr1/Pno1
MKEIYPLPEPKNKGIIKQIIGPGGKNLRYLENQAGIKPYDIKQKKNEVHIVGTKEQVDKVKKLLKEIIVSWYFNNIRAHLKM